MERFAEFVIQFFTRYGKTVILARIIRELRLQLEKRKEYALRYGPR
jgi:hypothetical protein